MQLFYTPDILHSVGNEYILNEEESKHCIRVLRLAKGDSVHLTNGQGTLYEAKIVRVTPKQCVLQVLSKKENYEKRPYYLHLAVAPTKNADRYEWMIEKAVEVGVDKITPLMCTHSERKIFKIDRAQRIIVSAMKQSLKAQLPILQEATSFESLVRQPFEGLKLIAHCGEGPHEAFLDVLKNSISTSTGTNPRFLILIGPEGDFTPQEVTLAEAQGFCSIHLGPSRLRTETAGLVAATGVYLHFI